MFSNFRFPMLTGRISRQISPLCHNSTITFSTPSHQVTAQQLLARNLLQAQVIRFTSTKNVKDTHSKIAVPLKSAPTKTLQSNFFNKKLRNHGNLLSKPAKNQVSVKPSRPTLPRPDKQLTVRPAATSGLEQKKKNGSTLGNTNPAPHKVCADVLYPGDTQLVRLPWGGVLSYARLGRRMEEGPVWVVFHGTPGSRLSNHGAHKYAESNAIRLISIDRPGYGHSTLKRGREMLDFIQDVEYLLNFLGVRQFKIEGTSGGGPYALAAAYHFPQARLLKTLVMCGMTNPDYDQASVPIVVKIKRMLAGYVPFYYRFMKYNIQAVLWRKIRDANGDQGQIKRIQATMQEIHRQGHMGYQYDLRLHSQPWDFNLEDIHAGPIRWYHGNMDVNTSSTAARATADHANRFRKTIEYKEFPGLDHFELQHRCFYEAYDWLRK